MNRPIRSIRAVAAAIALSLLCACSGAPVQAWEKGRLAAREMRLDRDALAARVADHIYVSREAASGSGAVGGGGCGCN